MQAVLNAKCRAGLAALLLVGSYSRAEETWALPDAVSRARVVQTGTDAPVSTTAHARVWPCGTGTALPSVRVFRVGGAEVNSHVLWAAPSEPISVLFDISCGDRAYDVYVTTNARDTSVDWTPRAGVVLETRQVAAGAADSWGAYAKVWDRSSPVLGRSLVPSIFLGIHPHGPTRNFAARYTGYLQIRKTGEYAFATLSDNASFLFIDGMPIAEWPGAHAAEGGLYGEHSGTVNLMPGVFRIDYYNLQRQTGFRAAAAWKTPGDGYFNIIPEEAFAPVVPFETSMQSTPPGVDKPCIGWRLREHLMAGEQAMVEVELSYLGKPGGRHATCIWTFDDGGREAGWTVRRLFTRTGIRRVTLSVSDPDTRSTEQWIHVHPVWDQQVAWPDATCERLRPAIVGREWAGAPIDDLAQATCTMDAGGDYAATSVLGEWCLRRMEDMERRHADLFRLLGEHFAHAEVRRYDDAERCYRAALTLAEADPDTRGRLNLAYAGFALDCRDNAELALELLARLPEKSMDPKTRRQAGLLTADARLAQGRVDVARTLYRAVPDVTGTVDTSSEITRRLRLETARDFVRRQEYAAAERLLDGIEWDTPMERMGAETGLMKVDIYTAREEYPRALSRCHRLRQAELTDHDEATVLRRVVECHLGLGRKEEARRVYRELVEMFPYGESAALAREAWAGLLEKAP